MYFTAPATILKSETEFKNNRVNVKVIASDESLDQEKDNILSKAFTEDVRNYFKESGIFDWDHYTIRGKTAEDKSAALIGTPVDFYEERVHGSPVQLIEGFLHKGNPHVDNSIEPCLKSGSDRICASIGGKILEFEKNKFGGRSVHKILMNHLAFTPKHKSVNFSTRVELLKSAGINKEDIYQFGTTNLLLKSMEAGFGTDVATMTGGQAIQPQSLEGSAVILTINDDYNRNLIARSILHDVVTGLINFDDDEIRTHSELYGLTPEDAKLISDLILTKLAKKVLNLRNNYIYENKFLM